MPFDSASQRRLMYANEPAMAKRWQEHTPKDKKLPEKKEKKAHDLGYIVGLAACDMPLETKLPMLKMAADEVGEIAVPVLAKQASLWLLEQERQHPGFIKVAASGMEKQAIGGIVARPNMPPVVPKPTAPLPGTGTAKTTLS